MPGSNPRKKDILPGGEKKVGRLAGVEGTEWWQLWWCSCVKTHC